jgi:hypothetical protein
MFSALLAEFSFTPAFFGRMIYSVKSPRADLFKAF